MSLPSAIPLGYLCTFAVSFVISAGLVATKSRHLHRTARQDDSTAVQAAHLVATPRIGGLAVVLAFAASVLWFVPPGLHPQLALFLLSIIPVAAAGLAEDIGFRISPRGRLVAAAISSLAAVALLQVWLTRSHMPGLDLLLLAPPSRSCSRYLR